MAEKWIEMCPKPQRDLYNVKMIANGLETGQSSYKWVQKWPKMSVILK